MKKYCWIWQNKLGFERTWTSHLSYFCTFTVLILWSWSRKYCLSSVDNIIMKSRSSVPTPIPCFSLIAVLHGFWTNLIYCPWMHRKSPSVSRSHTAQSKYCESNRDEKGECIAVKVCLWCNPDTSSLYQSMYMSLISRGLLCRIKILVGY